MTWRKKYFVMIPNKMDVQDFLVYCVKNDIGEFLPWAENWADVVGNILDDHNIKYYSHDNGDFEIHPSEEELVLFTLATCDMKFFVIIDAGYYHAV